MSSADLSEMSDKEIDFALEVKREHLLSARDEMHRARMAVVKHTQAYDAIAAEQGRRYRAKVTQLEMSLPRIGHA